MGERNKKQRSRGGGAAHERKEGMRRGGAKDRRGDEREGEV